MKHCNMSIAVRIIGPTQTRRQWCEAVLTRRSQHFSVTSEVGVIIIITAIITVTITVTIVINVNYQKGLQSTFVAD